MIVSQFGPFLLLFKFAVALGGAIVGYILSAPALKLLYRLAFQRAIPGWLLPLGRIASGGLLGALLFLLVTLGSGGMGLSGGSGGSGSEGGAGPGMNQVGGDQGKQAKDSSEPGKRTKVAIRLLGGADVIGERYYLVNDAEPAKTLAELEEFFKIKSGKWEVHVHRTDTSVATGHSADRNLQKLLEDPRIAVVTPPQDP